MFDSPQARDEPVEQPLRLWSSIYILWGVIGLFGFIVSFWKHGGARIFGCACYLTVFLLALSFLVQALRTAPPTRRRLSTQSTALLFLGLLPILVRDLLIR